MQHAVITILVITLLVIFISFGFFFLEPYTTVDRRKTTNITQDQVAIYKVETVLAPVKVFPATLPDGSLVFFVVHDGRLQIIPRSATVSVER